ncbi:MAG: hypothetical protein LBJ02_10695 [Bifidobacteriaceae bacterium]|jgi:hypothetical protein|nr:hypothetical protein [Bifidobacteriaceae bacterium]
MKTTTEGRKSVAKWRRLAAGVIVAGMATLGAGLPADAASGGKYWNYGSASYLRAYVYGSVGISDSGNWVIGQVWAAYNNPYASVYKYSGSAKVDMAEVIDAMSFGYVTGSVTSAPGFSVTGASKSCSHTYTSATGKSSVSGSYSGMACKASSWVAVWTSSFNVTGKLRINGGTWTSAAVKI